MKQDVLNQLLKRMDEMYPGEAEKLKHETKIRYQRYSRGEIGKADAITKHTTGCIIPVIATYEAFIKVFNDPQLGYDFIDGYFTEICGGAADKLRGIAGVLGIYNFVPTIMASIIRNQFGFKSGFEMVERKVTGKECHIDMLSCPYHNYCCRFGHPELTKVFCNSDDITYGHLHPKLAWERTKTLGRGDEYCDFKLRLNYPTHYK